MNKLGEIRKRREAANTEAAVFAVSNTVGCDMFTKQFLVNVPTDIDCLLQVVDGLCEELRSIGYEEVDIKYVIKQAEVRR